jgi:hypothetical protein
MLNISSAQPVAWSPAPAVSPLTAAAPVSPVQPAARDGQAGSSSAQGNPRGASGQPARRGELPAETKNRGAEKDPPVEAAPLLPRQSPKNQASPENAEIQAEADRDEQVREAEEKAFRQQFQDVVANIWKASAAVVDVVLGRAAMNADAAGDVPSAKGVKSAGAAVDAGMATGSGAKNAPAMPVGSAVASLAAPAAGDDQMGQGFPRLEQDIVAYDAQGQSSMMPLEAGTLVDRLV